MQSVSLGDSPLPAGGHASCQTAGDAPGAWTPANPVEGLGWLWLWPGSALASGIFG